MPPLFQNIMGTLGEGEVGVVLFGMAVLERWFCRLQIVVVKVFFLCGRFGLSRWFPRSAYLIRLCLDLHFKHMQNC